MRAPPPGILPPIVTPFRGEDLDTEALRFNLSLWDKAPLSGYVVGGSNGEGAYLTDAELIRIVEIAAAARAPAKFLVAGTGRESTRHTVALTREAARAGAEAVLVVPPHYYRSSMTESVLLRHYQTVADASDVPVILYHVPKFAPVTFSLGLILDLARHPNIAGIKETSGDLNLFAAILRERPPSFRVYVGAGGHLLAGAALGADGGVLAVANVAPLLCVEILELTAAGRLEEARALQMRLLSVNHAVTAGHGIAGLKYALRRLGYRSGDSLRPLEPLDPEAERHIDRVLEEAGLA